jgi:hypothetical protein
MYLYYVAEPLQVRLFDSVSKGFAAGDSNLYRYVFNGPTYTTDPTGEIVPIVAAIVAVMEIPATYEGFILLAAGIASVSGAAYVLLNHVAPPTIDINRLIEDFRLKGEWLYGNLLVFLLTKLDLNSRCVFCKPLPHLVVRPRPLHRAGITMIVFWP